MINALINLGGLFQVAGAFIATREPSEKVRIVLTDLNSVEKDRERCDVEIFLVCIKQGQAYRDSGVLFIFPVNLFQKIRDALLADFTVGKTVDQEIEGFFVVFIF